MKIESADTIRISGSTPAARIFRGLSPGAEVKARITERFGRNEAMLDISGRKIRAWFQNGVPGNNFLRLVLSEKSSGLFLFTLRSATSRTDFFENLKPFIIFSESEFRPDSAVNLNRYLASSPKSIFELNSLIRDPSLATAGQGLTAIFNALMKKNANPLWLQGLSYYLAETALGHPLFSMIHSLSEEHKKNRHRRDNQEKNREIIEDEINKIALEVDNISEEEERLEIVSGIISLLSSVNGKSGGMELPLFSGEGYTPLKCINSENAWIFQAEFSKTGRIEILARRNISSYIIDVHVENSEALAGLENEKEAVSLKTGMPVRFHNLMHSMDKLIAINAYFALNSQFDIKI